MTPQGRQRVVPTAHAVQGPGVAPQGKAQPFPSLRTVSAWTMRAQRRRVPLPWRQRLTDLYMLVLAAAMSAGAVHQLLLRSARGGAGGPDTASLFCPPPAGCAGASADSTLAVPMLATAALVLLGLAALTGALRRLGPLFLRPQEAHWLLPLPGRRGPLLRRRLAHVVLIGAGTGALLGAAAGLIPLVVTGGLGPRGAAHAGAVCLLAAGATLLAVAGAGAAQALGRRDGWTRPVLLALAAVNVLLAVGAIPAAGRLVPVVLALQALGLAAAAAYLWFRRVGPNLERVADPELLETSRRALGALVAGASLDSRSLGQLFAPAPRRPRRSAHPPLARLAPRLPRRVRVAAAVLHADCLVLSRQLWRLSQLAAGVAMVAALLLPLAPLLQLGVLLTSGATTALAAGAAARASHAEPDAENRLPASALAVRASHLLAPLLVLLPWASAVGAALRLGVLARSEAPAQAGAPGPTETLTAESAWLLAAQCLLLGLSWAAAAVRSAYRPSPNWNLFVATEMGPVPVGLLSSAATGPDVALVSVLPFVPVLLSGIATTGTVLAQAVVACVAMTAAILPARLAP